jgi:hypothetical protein
MKLSASLTLRERRDLRRWRAQEKFDKKKRAAGFFIHSLPGHYSWWMKMPHATPKVIAICNVDGKRKYQHCRTRDQALAFHPTIIEHVNGFGQVTLRERQNRPTGALVVA